MILAHKGFDGLQLEIDSSGLVSAAIIFEDKATDHARKTITAEVWPEFRRMEAGDRENVLMAEVSALLQTNPALDADKAIENIIWKQVRRYRVSLTVSAKDATPKGRQKLFAGFDSVAAGSVDRRRAEIFEIDELRKWMAALAHKTIACIKATAT
jgi:hypothetical protein